MNKIVVNRDYLVSRLEKAIKFIPDTSIIPQMDNFKMTITNNLMEIIASTSSQQIKLFCPVESKTNWSFCVPAELLLKTTRLYRESEITITQKSTTKIELKAGKSKYNISLNCQPENYDPMTITGIHSEIVMHQKALSVGLSNARDFVDAKHPNKNFANVNMAEIDNKIVFTGATQVQITRIAIRPISITKWEKSVAFSVETAKLISGLVGDSGEVNVSHSDSKIKFLISSSPEDSVEMVSVIHTDKYPGTESMFKAIAEEHITINTTDFLDALKRLNLYTSTGVEPMVNISNRQNSQEFMISSVDENNNHDGEEIITVVNPSSLIFEKKVATKSVMLTLNHIESAECHIHFKPNVGPWHIIPSVQTQQEDIFKFMLSQIL